MHAEAAATPRLCARCKEHDGVLDLRSEAVCRTCFAAFVASKAIKRLEVLQRETRGPRLPARPQRYLLALSRGPSSTALLHVLGENVRRQRERNQRAKFELVVVFVDVDVVDADGEIEIEGESESERRRESHVDGSRTEKTGVSAASDPENNGIVPGADASTATSASSPKLTSTSTSTGTDPFTAHFPDLTLHTLPLSTILSSRAIDWSALPSQDPYPDPHRRQSPTPAPASSPRARLSRLLSRLPSAAARADVTRLLTRHALLAAAASHGCAVVLLGHSTTSLAELTLSEAAKGRGFGVPWLVNDGAFPLPRTVDGYGNGNGNDPSTAATETETETDMTGNGDAQGLEQEQAQIQVYSPLREVFRKEILTYLSIVHTSVGPLSSLLPPSSISVSPSRAVVSHRDQSLDEVVARYFADVEASYPSVVANVVRTTGKLSREAPVAAAVRPHLDTGTGVGVGVGVVRTQQCGLCGVRLDPLGDERWKGEIGHVDANNADDSGQGMGGGSGSGRARLCYGCDRSVKG
ncbi:hypothetical protein F5Y14DRAFT_142540 [Nemania sp. NC0429]|nr:hypothetical protein F5Y14DRAFT_142540 [Nemania sp. NC0429]